DYIVEQGMDTRQYHGRIAYEHACGAFIICIDTERMPQPAAYVDDAGCNEIRVNIRNLVHLLLLNDVARAHCADDPRAGKTSYQYRVVQLYSLVSLNEPYDRLASIVVVVVVVVVVVGGSHFFPSISSGMAAAATILRGIVVISFVSLSLISLATKECSEFLFSLSEVLTLLLT